MPHMGRAAEVAGPTPSVCHPHLASLLREVVPAFACLLVPALLWEAVRMLLLVSSGVPVCCVLVRQAEATNMSSK